jgi:hypothetical protein
VSYDSHYRETNMLSEASYSFGFSTNVVVLRVMRSAADGIFVKMFPSRPWIK